MYSASPPYHQDRGLHHLRAKEGCKLHLDSVLEEMLWERLACYTPIHVIENLRARFKVVVAESTAGSELLLVPPWAIPLIDAACPHIFTAGLHVASLRRDKLLFHLSLGQLIEDVIIRGYIVLPEPLVKKLLYGRSLLVNPRGIEYEDTCQPVAVLDEQRDFIAWARISHKDGKLLIKPLVDAGWYLRSGV